MDYKKRYKKAREKNKTLVDKIEDLKDEISNLKDAQGESYKYTEHLINELEDIRYEFIRVVDDLNRCKDDYIVLRNMILREKKMALFRLKISSKLIDIKYKLISIFNFRKYK